jgi:hypothetical protein
MNDCGEFIRRIVMAANLAKLDVPNLLRLRDEVEARLVSMRELLANQLASLSMTTTSRTSSTGERAHGLTGRKRNAKYRDPQTGKTWAGVGMLPLWLKAYEAEGKSREQFAMTPNAPESKKTKRRAKKAGRK